MKLRDHTAFRLGAWVGIFMLFGCAAEPLMREEPPVRENPPWQLMSSGAHETADGRTFYGIGQAQGSHSEILLRATAINRAREALAKVLERYAAELLQAAQTLPALSVEEGEQLTGGLVRDAMALSVISAQSYDPGRGRLYTLCRLDLSRFKQVLAARTTLPADLRAAMAREAEWVHAMMVKSDQ
ncbi:MAG: hypothetical protein P8X96_25985 [Desulfobacteraceae bacterium]